VGLTEAGKGGGPGSGAQDGPRLP